VGVASDTFYTFEYMLSFLGFVLLIMNLRSKKDKKEKGIFG
jgi:hypothetical protein